MRRTSLCYADEVATLLEQGYCLIELPAPVRIVLPSAAAQFQHFLDETRAEEGRQRRWMFALSDPDDPDEGLLERTGWTGDEKSVFNYKEGLHSVAEWRFGVDGLTKIEQAFLSSCAQLHGALLSCALDVARAIDAGAQVPEVSFLAEVEAATRTPAAWSRHMLRHLFYPPRADGEMRRAGVHRDRSLFTLHLGDRGGYLYTPDTHGMTQKIEVPLGMAAVFFGRKAEHVSQGKLRALPHGSSAQPGETRRATVFFVHANLELQHSS